MAHIRKHKMDEHQYEEMLSLKPGSVSREGDYFMVECRAFGDGFLHYLRLPQEVYMENINSLHSPLTVADDCSGTLMELLGNVFEGFHLLSLFYREVPGEKRDELPVYEIVGPDDTDMTPATHLIVQVIWPLDRPPAPDLNMESDFAGLFKAVSHCSQPLDDDDAHGTDFWVFDLTAFDADGLCGVWRDHALVLKIMELSWEYFDLERPYYRRLMHDACQSIQADYLSVEMGEDYATVKLFSFSEPKPGQERELMRSAKMWYDQAGVSAMQDVARVSAISNLGDLLRELSCL